MFLTVILEPWKISDFRELAKIGSDYTLIRSRIIRKNIRYSVVFVDKVIAKLICNRGWNHRYPSQEQRQKTAEEEALLAKAMELAKGFITTYETGKVIVYSGTIERVRKLGEQLDCSIYFSNVDTAEAKAQILERWRDGERVIVATNALGMGIDQPDIRLVIHVEMPSQVRGFVQESGRGGRDGLMSYSVVVCKKTSWTEEAERYRKSVTEQEWREPSAREIEIETREFICKQQCRRIVLDRVMDGYLEREECEEEEERCDICRIQHEKEMEEAIREAEEFEYDSVNARMQRDEKMAAMAEYKTQEKKMEEIFRQEQLLKDLKTWKESCIACRLMQATEYEHEREECPLQQSANGAAAIRQAKEMVLEEIWKKKKLERFGGCFGCGIPQKICDRWESQEGDGGSFEMNLQRRCQFEGLLAEFIGIAMVFGPKWVEKYSKRVVKEKIWQWLGQRVVRWHGLETNQMCVMFFEICRVIEGGIKLID